MKGITAKMYEGLSTATWTLEEQKKEAEEARSEQSTGSPPSWYGAKQKKFEQVLDFTTQFHQLANVPASPIYDFGPEKIAMARQAFNMLAEEMNGKDELLQSLEKFMKSPSLENLVGVLDGGLDVFVVLMQLFYQLDLPFGRGICEVNENNVAKLQFDDNGEVKKREDGKILKPEGHQKPRLMEILLEHSNYRARQLGEQGADNWN